MNWIPSPGDRVKTIISRDAKNEIVFLNSNHVIDSTISAEFLVLTSEWIPWSHQIIDYLSSTKNLNRAVVLKALIEFDKQHSELDFDELCLLFLKENNL